MPTLSQQNEDLSDPHPIRSQTSLPRAGFDEHCNKALHEALGDQCPVGSLLSIATSQRQGYGATRNCLSVLDTHLASRRPIRTRARHMSFEPFGATLMQMNFRNMAMALARWDDLNMHDCLARTELKSRVIEKHAQGSPLRAFLYSALCDLYD